MRSLSGCSSGSGPVGVSMSLWMGFYLDRLALFEGVELAVLEQQITLWQSGEEVKAGLLNVEPGSAVLIDEVQTVFRSKDKTDPQLLRWLETHRHRGIDLVLMCQQYGQVTLGVNRLVEATTKFRRLDRFGLKNRYQASVRGNPEELEVIRMFSGKYEPKLYAYYSSYASASVRETARGGSMLKSPTLLVGILGLLVAVAWFAFGGWLSGVKPVPAAAVSKLSLRLRSLRLQHLSRWRVYPLSCLRPCIRSAFKAA